MINEGTVNQNKQLCCRKEAARCFVSVSSQLHQYKTSSRVFYCYWEGKPVSQLYRFTPQSPYCSDSTPLATKNATTSDCGFRVRQLSGSKIRHNISYRPELGSRSTRFSCIRQVKSTTVIDELDRQLIVRHTRQPQTIMRYVCPRQRLPGQQRWVIRLKVSIRFVCVSIRCNSISA